ncbi:DUF494 family protein [Caldithrix abyssi]
MEERLIEVIMYLLKEFNNLEEKADYNSLSRKLMASGYSNVEINFALNWIFNHLTDKKPTQEEEFEYSSRANRVLHDLEKIIFTPEAYGYLLQMRQLGLLNDTEFEEVVDEAIMGASPTVSVDDIKRIAAMVVFGNDVGKHANWEGFFYPFGSNTIH